MSVQNRHHHHNVDVGHVEVEIPEMLQKKRSPVTAKSLQKMELSDDEISQSSGQPSGFDNVAYSFEGNFIKGLINNRIEPFIANVK